MIGGLISALLLLALFVAAGWAVLRFGGGYLRGEQQRRIAAGAIAAGGLLVGSLVFFNSLDSPPEPHEFLVTTDLNQGAVSFPFMIRQAGVEHELQIWPQRGAGGEPRGLLKLRVILSGPGNVELINEAVTVATAETDIARADGSSVRGIDWIPWSQSFSPASAGFYEIALSLPPKAPRIRVRVGAPQSPGE